MDVKEIRVFRPPCDVSSEVVGVKVLLHQDLSDLMPYVKGELDQVKYFPKGPYVKFVFKGRAVTVNGDYIAIGGFSDDESARGCADEVVALLQDLDRRRDSITPDTTPFNPPTVMDVFKLLPRKAGCGQCGYPACMAFAVALTKEETAAEMCPELAVESNAASMIKLKNMLGG